MKQSSTPINPLSDGHIHTSLCHHAIGTMEDYVLAAIGKGLQEIIFLEHMEEGIYSKRITWLSEEDFDFYFKEGRRLQGKYGNRLSIGLGVEVGYNPPFRDALLKRIRKRKWDRIGISCHFHKIENTEEPLNLLSSKDAKMLGLNRKACEQIKNNYYQTLIEAVKFLPGTVLCHLDAALRYHPLIQTTEQQLPLIDILLDGLKKKGMALEINTSGMRIRKEFFPSHQIILMARAKGIPLVAGSDAHKPEEIGNYFSELVNI